VHERFHEALWGAIVGLFPGDAQVEYADHNWIVIRCRRRHADDQPDEHGKSVVIIANERVAKAIDEASDYQVARLARNAERVIARSLMGYQYDDLANAFQIRLDDEVLGRE